MEVAAGYLITCGIVTDGTVKCWGYDTYEDVLGQAPGPVGHWSLASGARHSCATSSDSSVTCWGASDDGQDAAPTGTFREVSIGRRLQLRLGDRWHRQLLGDAPRAARRPPCRCARSRSATGMPAPIASDGTLACWGANDAGQSTPPAGQFAAVTVGASHSCAIAANGSLACWGANDAGQATPPAGTFVALSAGTDHDLCHRHRRQPRLLGCQ